MKKFGRFIGDRTAQLEDERNIERRYCEHYNNFVRSFNYSVTLWYVKHFFI